MEVYPARADYESAYAFYFDGEGRLAHCEEKHPETDIRHMLDQKIFFVRALVLYIGVMAVVIFGIYGSGYNAADFVYMQF